MLADSFFNRPALELAPDLLGKPVLFMRALKVTHFRQLDDPLTVFGLGGYDFR